MKINTKLQPAAYLGDALHDALYAMIGDNQANSRRTNQMKTRHQLTRSIFKSSMSFFSHTYVPSVVLNGVHWSSHFWVRLQVGFLYSMPSHDVDPSLSLPYMAYGMRVTLFTIICYLLLSPCAAVLFLNSHALAFSGSFTLCSLFPTKF